MAVDTPDLVGYFVFGLVSIGSDRSLYLLGNPTASGARAEDDHAHIGEVGLADLEAGHDGCKSDAACTLNVVVEAGGTRAVAVEQTAEHS